MYICRNCGNTGVSPAESYDKATGRMERSCHRCEHEDLLYLAAVTYKDIADVLDTVFDTLCEKMSKHDAKKVVEAWLSKKD